MTVKIAMWDFGQCDSARCSGRKLKRHGKLFELSKRQRFYGVILCAEAKRTLSISDSEIVKNKGICVIDCSWNQINRLPLKILLHSGYPRKLPFLVAANPCHFGRPYELNCAEAIAATLFITGFVEQAADVMSIFKWGPHFFHCNCDALDQYSEQGLTEQHILAIEKQIIESRNRKSKLKWEDVLPPTSSSDSDYGDALSDDITAAENDGNDDDAYGESNDARQRPGGNEGVSVSSGLTPKLFDHQESVFPSQ